MHEHSCPSDKIMGEYTFGFERKIVLVLEVNIR